MQIGMTGALGSLVEELEQDSSLHTPDALRRRVEALDCLEAYLFDPSTEEGVYGRAKSLCTRLEEANGELYRAIRAEIQHGARPEILLERVREAGRIAQGEGYDYLDEVIAGILQFEEPGAGVAPPGAEMVFYQPTPARHIFDLIGRMALTERDALVDLGSGLGHVALLASILTGARCVGIELEPAYVDCARRSAEGLHLTNVTFVEQDARRADLSAGTVFYLYTPFTGTILRSVLDALRREAAGRQIQVCTFGPCTVTVAGEEWLEGTGTVERDRVAVFRSRR